MLKRFLIRALLISVIAIAVTAATPLLYVATLALTCFLGYKLPMRGASS